MIYNHTGDILAKVTNITDTKDGIVIELKPVSEEALQVIKHYIEII